MQGKEAAAEYEWNFACDRISVGCSRYTDRDWLSRIRRFVVTSLMQFFRRVFPHKAAGRYAICLSMLHVQWFCHIRQAALQYCQYFHEQTCKYLQGASMTASRFIIQTRWRCEWVAGSASSSYAAVVGQLTMNGMVHRRSLIPGECRWPPRMVEKMEAFVALASAKQPAPV